MATTITSPNTNDVVNWAYKYSLACGKLTAAENAASSSATRSKDIATAKADFNSTMKSLVPTDAQSSVQFQYMDALTQYNTDLASATTEKGRQAALTTLYSTLEGITMPAATSTTLADLASANKATASNAAANIKSMASNAAANIKTMASNAGSSWLKAVASGANILNTQASNLTESIKTALAQVGVDTSNITTPTITTSAASTFAAGSASATTGGSAGSILNAALIGYLVAEQAGGG